MGLDMYLYKDVYVYGYDHTKGKNAEPKKIEVMVKYIYPDGSDKKEKFSAPFPEFGFRGRLPYMYWRKRNAIHKWFVDNFANGEDDCREMWCSGKDLLGLVKICEEVLKDHSKAELLLPTEDGFFFGPVEYDDWYFKGLRMTVDRLKDVDPNDTFIYVASW